MNPPPQPGKTVEFRRTFSAEEVRAYANLTLDNNPIHLDPDYASGSIFKKRVVHGMFLAGMFSKIFGTIYPGEGGIYLKQSLKFVKPAYFDQEIRAVATLTDFDADRNRGQFTTECFDPEGNLLVSGEATLLFPK